MVILTLADDRGTPYEHSYPELPYEAATPTRTVLGVMEEKLGGRDVVDQVLTMTGNLTAYEYQCVLKEMYHTQYGEPCGSGAVAQAIMFMLGSVECPFTRSKWTLAGIPKDLDEPFQVVEQEMLNKAVFYLMEKHMEVMKEGLIDGDEEMARNVLEIKFTEMEEKSKKCLIESRRCNIANLEQVQLPNVHRTDLQIEDDFPSLPRHFYAFRIGRLYSMPLRAAGVENPWITLPGTRSGSLQYFVIHVPPTTCLDCWPKSKEQQYEDTLFYDEDGNPDYGNLNFDDDRWDMNVYSPVGNVSSDFFQSTLVEIVNDH